MIRISVRRRVKPVALLLLVLQALGGSAASLAHATERTSAPAAFESRHTAACVVLHDAERCALCQYTGLRVTAHAGAVRSPDAPPDGRRAYRPLLTAPAVAVGIHRSDPPRAPPTPHS